MLFVTARIDALLDVTDEKGIQPQDESQGVTIETEKTVMRRKKMKASRCKNVWVMIIFAAVLLVPVHGLAAESVNIEGEVGDNYQIITSNGQIYEISDTSQGNDLAENYLGEKVKVTGTLEKEGDVEVLTIISFEKMAE